MSVALALAPTPGLQAESGAGPHPTAWLLDSPLRERLSGAGELALLIRNGMAPTPAAATSVTGAPQAPPTGGTDLRVNAPGQGEFAPNCNTQNEVHLARSGQNLVAGWNDGGQCDYLTRSSGISLSGYGYSSDGGLTWTDGGVIQPEPGGNSFGDPVVAADADGNFYYAELADNASGRSIIGVAKSTDGGKTWSAPVDATPGRSAGAIQDKEWIAVDTTSSPHRGNVYVHWIEFASTAEQMFSRSTDGGQTFGDAIKITTSAAQRGQGAQVAVGPDGEVYVVWESLGATRSLWFRKSVDGGQTFTAPRQITTLSRIGHTANCALGGTRDVLNGDIRVLEWPSLAVDTSGSSDPLSPDFNPHRGTIYVAAPSRGAGADESDVYIVSSSDGGVTWTSRRKLNDDTTTTDQFHAQIAVGPDATVAVTWYDRRLSNDPLRANWLIDQFATVSTDGGQTFAPNFRVSDVSFPPSRTNPNTNLLAGCYMGEYNGLVAGEAGEFFADWGDNRDGLPELPDPNVYFDRIRVSG